MVAVPIALASIAIALAACGTGNQSRTSGTVPLGAGSGVSSSSSSVGAGTAGTGTAGAGTGADTEADTTPTMSKTDGCSGNTPALAIVNGLSSCDYLAVVHIVMDAAGNEGASSCTATFVSDRALVTAAHCINPGDGGGVQLVVGPHQTIEATKSFSTGNRVDGFPDDSDAAIILFDPGTAPISMPLAPTRPIAGQRVDLVGYGITDFNDDGKDVALTKHVGSNAVMQDMATVPTPGDPIWVGGQTLGGAANDKTGKTAFASYGDSGGPLVVNGALAGIAHTTDGKADSTSASVIVDTYVDIHRASIRSLIDQANAAGAGIKIPAGWIAAGG